MNSASMVDWLTHLCRVEDQEMGAPAANKRYPVRSLVFPTARPVAVGETTEIQRVAGGGENVVPRR
jgi:hypothetical protein